MNPTWLVIDFPNAGTPQLHVINVATASEAIEPYRSRVRLGLSSQVLVLPVALCDREGDRE